MGFFALAEPPGETSLSIFSACLPFGGVITLTIVGWCELATGTGAVNGHAVDVHAVNGDLVVSGAAVGRIRLFGSAPCVYQSQSMVVSWMVATT